MTSPAPIPHEELLSHRAWVRALARALVGPDHADDLEQQTWLTALRARPGSVRSWRPWLGTVIRNHARKRFRASARRTTRECGAARRDRVEATADLVATADAHRHVVDAVMALPEHHRDALLLRYFEGLPVREVAERMETPLETARARLRRAREQLRARLSGELGDERRLGALLAPLLALHRGKAPAAAGWSVGVLSFAAGALAIAVGTVALVAARVDVGDVAAAPAVVDAADAADAEGAGPVAPDEDEDPPAVEDDDDTSDVAVAPGAQKPPSIGERLDRVGGPVDFEETPLIEVLGRLSGKADVDFVLAAEAARYVEQGESQVDALRLEGEVTIRVILNLVTSFRGLAFEVEDDRVVVVRRGVTRDPDLPAVAVPRIDPDAPTTIVVRGVVRDAAGAAVGGASLESYWPNGRFEAAGVADDTGAFELEVGRPFPSLRARAPGRVPSLARTVAGEPGTTVSWDLALRGPAARLTGVVLDESGVPVAGNRVRVLPSGAGGRNIRLEGGIAASDPALQLITDNGGAFATDEVRPGRVTVSTWRKRGERAQQTLDVSAGVETVVELRLSIGVSMSGTVRDEDGRPVHRALVHGRHANGSVMRSVLSGPDGRYRLTGLSSDGRMEVYVRKNGVGEALLAPEKGAGLPTRWDPVLQRGRSISGRLLDGDGRPLKGWAARVLETRLDGGRPRAAVCVTDDEGRFTLTPLKRASVDIGFTMPMSFLPVIARRGVATDGAVLTVQVPDEALPSATIRGRVVRAESDPLLAVELLVLRLDVPGRSEAKCKMDSGRFETPLLPPGEYALSLRVAKKPDIIDLGTVVLEAQAKHDLGDLTIPEKAPLVLRVRRPKLSGKVWIYVWTHGTVSAYSFPVVRSALADAGDPSFDLRPGAYRVRIAGVGVQLVEQVVDVAAGKGGELALVVRAAPTRHLALQFPAGVDPSQVRVEARTVEGDVLAASVLCRAPPDGGPIACGLCLVPNAYALSVLTDDGTQLSGTLRIPAGNDGGPFEVVLTR